MSFRKSLPFFQKIREELGDLLFRGQADLTTEPPVQRADVHAVLEWWDNGSDRAGSP